MLSLVCCRVFFDVFGCFFDVFGCFLMFFDVFVDVFVSFSCGFKMLHMLLCFVSVHVGDKESLWFNMFQPYLGRLVRIFTHRRS